MPKTIKVPLLGQVPKGAVIAGAGAAVVVTGYLIYKHSQDATSAAGATGYGAAAYGYNAGLPFNTFYGYGSNYAPSGVTPYPVGSEYGYGAYGYGDYNPYTGQYLGGGVGTTVPPTVPPPTTTPPAHQKGKWVTINGIKEYFNPNKNTIGHWVGTGKKRHWVKTKV
jgi:hypothetical protein